METNRLTNLPLDGVLVRVGWKPQSNYLKGVVPLNNQEYIFVKGTMETQISEVFAAGDIRHGFLKQIAAPVGDGTAAAIAAQKYLRKAI